MAELLVTLVVLSILLMVAVPSFNGVMNSNRTATTVNELTATVGLVRAEALRSTRGAYMCASSDGASCGTDWSEGWIVWNDLDGNGAVAASEVIRHVQAKRGMQIVGPGASIRFDSRGRIVAGAPATITLQPEHCGERALRRTMVISTAGQLQKGAAEECQ